MALMNRHQLSTGARRTQIVAALAAIGLGLTLWLYPYSRAYNPRYWGREKYIFDDDTWIQQICLSAAAIFATAPIWGKWIEKKSPHQDATAENHIPGALGPLPQPSAPSAGEREQIADAAPENVAVGRADAGIRSSSWPTRLVGVVLQLHTFTARLIERAAHPSRRARRITAGAIFLFGGVLLLCLALGRGRIMRPAWHDENMYRMQTTFLSHGKFCTPALPLPDFFDSPYIFVRGVYGPVYFLGTALLHVPAAWLDLPYSAMPLLIAATSLMLLYLIVTELLDGMWGLLAPILMISLAPFRWLSVVEMSHAAGMLWGLVALWSWLCWRKNQRISWALLAGLAAGFYGVTRPLDALGVLAPVAIAWAWDLRRVGLKKAIATIVAAIVMAAPLLGLQLAFDHAMTGKAMHTPLDSYNLQYFNVRSLGLQKFDPAFRPPTPVPQIQSLYAAIDGPAARQFTTLGQAWKHWTQCLTLTLGCTMPTLFLLALWPASVAGLGDARRWVLWLMLWCYLATCALFYIFMGQYTAAAAPAAIFTTLLGANALMHAWPHQNVLKVFLPLAIFLLAAQCIVQNPRDVFEPFPGRVTRANYFRIPSLVQKPALVLFRFGPDEEAMEEPVYNWDVVWPDDAPIIRAHDLGTKRDAELFDYYAKVQPQRTVYLFDRPSLTLQRLGNVKSLAEQANQAALRHDGN